MASQRWYGDRVQESSTTTGTGNFTLGGAPDTSYQTFNAVFGNGTSATAKRFRYVIVDGTNGAFETGLGYLSGATTLVREVVTSSSNSNAAVNFSSGTKTVFNDVTADVANDIIRRGKVVALMSGNFMG